MAAPVFDASYAVTLARTTNPANGNPTNVAINGSTIYALVSFSASHYLARYTSAGAVDATFSPILLTAQRPSSVPSRFARGRFEAIAFDNNKLFIAINWIDTSDSSSRRLAIDRYNLDGSFDAHVSVSTIGNIGVLDFDLRGTLAVYADGSQTVNSINTSTGALTARVTNIGSSIHGVAIAATRIYVQTTGNGIKVYDHSWNAVTADDIATSGFLSLETDGAYLYYFTARSLRRYSGVPVGRQATLTWGGVDGGLNLKGNLNVLGAPVSGIAPADFEVINGSGTTQTGWTIAVANTSVTSGRSTTVTATPPTNTNGSYKLRLKANSLISDGIASNTIPTTALETAAFTVNNQPLVASATWQKVTGGENLQGELVFSGSGITGLTNTDIEILNDSDAIQSGWVIIVSASSADTNNPITVTATPPASTNGSFKFRLKRRSVRGERATEDNSPDPAVVSTASSVNNIVPRASAEFQNVTGGLTLTADLSITVADITGLTGSDIEVIDAPSSGASQVQSGWTVAVGSASVTADTTTTVTATPPVAGVDGTFRLRLKRHSIRSTGGTEDNSPTAAVTSSAVAVDNRVDIATMTWTNVKGPYVLEAQLNVSGADITDLTAADLEVFNQLDAVQLGWTFEIFDSDLTAGTHTTVIALPPETFTDGTYYLRLKLDSVKSDGSLLDNAPAANVDSAQVSIINQPNGSIKYLNRIKGVSGTYLTNAVEHTVDGNTRVYASTENQFGYIRNLTTDPGLYLLPMQRLVLSGHVIEVVILLMTGEHVKSESSSRGLVLGDRW